MKKRLLPVLIAISVTIGSIYATGCEIIPNTEVAPIAPTTGNTTTPTTQPSTTPVAVTQTLPTSNPGALDLPSIADVVAAVKPAVVAINVEVTSTDFFNRQFTQQGAGSGWIIDPSGIIVTNNHVVEGASSISVILDDERSFEVDLSTLATDPLTDLAVLRIDATDLPVAELGDSASLRVGDWVVAIGNSLGEGIRATQGIVSRKDAKVPIEQGQTLYGMIETDAAINPGNSGGPLVSIKGQVIGINSAKYSAVGVEATGYAISMNSARGVIQDLINNGRAIHPFLGASLVEVTPFYQQTYDLAVDEGVIIGQLVSGGPADQAGLEELDVIVNFNGTRTRTLDDLIQAIRSARVGQEVEIIYWRGASQSTAQATLIERPVSP